MSTVERWRGVTPGGQPVRAYLEHADTWPGHAWRVEWGPDSGARAGRETFSGLDMEQQARAYLTAKLAELGTDWQQVER